MRRSIHRNQDFKKTYFRNEWPNINDLKITQILPTPVQANDPGLVHGMETGTTLKDSIKYNSESYVTDILLKSDLRYHKEQCKGPISLENNWTN